VKIVVLAAAFIACVAIADAPSRGQLLELRRTPYLGVACPGAPNSIKCDRVGLAVWLKRPAIRVGATVTGRQVTMRIPRTFRPSRYLGRRGEYWEGFLQPAGLISGPLRVRPDRGRYIWFGRHPVHAKVRIAAFYRDGSSSSTVVRVSLRPGWG
jgi:hypothetical protein